MYGNQRKAAKYGLKQKQGQKVPRRTRYHRHVQCQGLVKQVVETAHWFGHSELLNTSFSGEMGSEAKCQGLKFECVVRKEMANNKSSLELRAIVLNYFPWKESEYQVQHYSCTHSLLVLLFILKFWMHSAFFLFSI